MGYILLSPKEQAIKTLFSREMAVGAELSVGSLLASFVIVWGTTIVTFGSAMPVGLFIPNILAGACLGRAVGQQLCDSGLFVRPDVYALMGAAGALAGFSRMTISLAVIFLEITNNMNMLLPLMLVIMASKQVADLFGPSVYDIVLEGNPEVHLLDDGLSEDHELVLEGLTVHDLAATDVYVFKSFEQLEKVMQVLLSTNYSAYPVVDVDGRLLGIVDRTKLLLVVDQEKELVGTGQSISLICLAETAPEVTHCNTPVVRAYRHFRASGLQHLCVVDHKNALQGIATRTDFAKLCKAGKEGVEAVREVIQRKEAAASSGQVVPSGKLVGQDRVCVFGGSVSDSEGSTPTCSNRGDDLYDETASRPSRSSSTPKLPSATCASPGKSRGVAYLKQ
jgi:chloride channel 7